MGVKQKFQNLKTSMTSNHSLTFKEQLGYSGGVFGNAMGQDSVHTYGDNFCRDCMGIDNDKMIVKDLIAQIISFIIPPIAGAYCDSHTLGKKSHLRKTLFIMPIPFAITSMLLFIVPTTSAFYNFLWSLLLGIGFSVVDTFYDIAMATLGLRICTNPNDRNGFYTFTSLASSLGSMLPGFVIPIFVEDDDPVSKQKFAYFVVALVFCILGVSAMYAPYISLRQKADMAMEEYYISKAKSAAKEKVENITWDKETIRSILHNRPFMVLQLSKFFDMIRQITYKNLTYLYKDVFDDFKMKPKIEPISGALSYAGLLAVPFISSHFSARNIVAGGYAYSAFFYLLVSLFNVNFSVKKIRKYKWAIGLLIGFSGMPNNAQGAARKIITADSTDYMEWYGIKEYGRPTRSDGILSATENITAKASDLAKTALNGFLFKAIDYKEQPQNTDVRIRQSDSTLHGIFMIVSLCGLIGNALCSIVFMFDNYTGKNKERIFRELTEMREEREKIIEEINA